MRVLLALLLGVGMIGCGGDSTPPTSPLQAGKSSETSSAVKPATGHPVPQEVSGSGANGKTIKNSIGMRLRLIPAGEFLMGNPATEESRSPDETQHRVKLTKPFYLGVTEVTQSQYERVMDRNFSRFKDPQNPAETVSWEDAVDFCRKLSALPAEKAPGHQYRLPTEAE